MEEQTIRLKKRESPQDYIDGYRTALKAVKEYVEQQLATIENVQRAHDSIDEN